MIRTLIAAFLFTTPVMAQDMVAATLILEEAGLFCPHEKGEDMEAPGTALGFISGVDGRMPVDLPIRTIPATLEIGFGIRYYTEPGVTLNGAIVTVTHPPYAANGQSVERWTTDIEPDRMGVSAFTFDYEFEQLPGTWSFSIDHDGTRLLHQTFEIVPDGSIPQVLSVCFDQQMMS